MLGIRLRRLAPALLIAVAAACGGRRWGGTPPPTALVFTNESLNQADVYLVSGASARRIGTVMTGHTDTLLVPPDIAARGNLVNVVARLFTRSVVAQTGPVTIHQGQMYEVRLPPDARLLSFLRLDP